MWKAALGLANLIVVLGVALFGSAGTLHFTEAWVFLGAFAAASLAITIDLARNDPAPHAGRSARRAAREPEAHPGDRERVLSRDRDRARPRSPVRLVARAAAGRH